MGVEKTQSGPNPLLLFVASNVGLGGSSQSLLLLLKYLQEANRFRLLTLLPSSGPLCDVLQRKGLVVDVAGPEGFTRRGLPGLVRYIHQRVPSLVYCNGFSSATRNVVLAARLVGVPVIWHVREVIYDAPLANSMFLWLANQVVAVSQASARAIKARSGRSRVTIIPNGVDLTDFPMRVSQETDSCEPGWGASHGVELTLLNVGRLVRAKNHADAIRAAAKVRRQLGNGVLSIVGGDVQDEAYMKYLHGVIAECQMADCVRFLGRTENLYEHFIQSDILVHTSCRDAHPRAVLEAMATGLPVVAYGVDGVVEQVVDGVTGFLVPFGDVNGLVARIVQLGHEPDLRAQMGQAGRERIKNEFTADHTGQRVLHIIEGLLAQ